LAGGLGKSFNAAFIRAVRPRTTVRGLRFIDDLAAAQIAHQQADFVLVLTWRRQAHAPVHTDASSPVAVHAQTEHRATPRVRHEGGGPCLDLNAQLRTRIIAYQTRGGQSDLRLLLGQACRRVVGLRGESFKSVMRALQRHCALRVDRLNLAVDQSNAAAACQQSQGDGQREPIFDHVEFPVSARTQSAKFIGISWTSGSLESPVMWVH
jgi:hypothetical protein